MGDAAELIRSAFLVLSALIPIVNPLGGSPIFLSLTGHYSNNARQALSRVIALNSLFLLAGSYLIGTHILAFFGISLPVVQVGGGLIVISAGWRMLQRGDHEDKKVVRDNVTTDDPFLQAFYPLTLPLTVGPGSISVAITLGANAPHSSRVDLLGVLGAIIGISVTAASVYLCYGFADRLARMLGPTAMSVVARLSSFLLVCIGVQILWNGISALFASVSFNVH
jgi:multiple antibiotic resistance protein